MSEVKHTPGPWQVETFEADGNFTCYTLTNTQGAEHGLEAEANARLIASAPELLEALKALCEDYKQLADSGDAGFWDFEEQEVAKKARAAIAKAEKGQP